MAYVISGTLNISGTIHVHVHPNDGGGGGGGPTPVAWWKFDDGSGSTVSDFIGARDGTISGSTAWTTGEDGGGLDMTGGSVDFGRIVELEGGAAWTIWGRWKWSSGTSACLFAYDDDNTLGNTNGSDLYVYWSGTALNVGISDISVEETTSITDFDDTNWHHIALTYDGAGSLKVYQNGTLMDTFSFTPGTFSSSHVFKVAHDYNINAFQGIVDDLRIYDTELNGAAIAALP